jgi:hypothetical protein
MGAPCTVEKSESDCSFHPYDLGKLYLGYLIAYNW